ncbi:MAG TPA: hypothetical protein P5123_00010 [Spirochaetota bacterium]|nr:hypothetical protein [Spirochaetota bacterium]
MKVALKKLGVILFLLFFVLSFAGCEDDEDKAQGRISNMTDYDFLNVKFADQNMGDVIANTISEYKDLKLEGGFLQFDVAIEGVYETYIYEEYLEAPKKDKKYTFVITYSEYTEKFSGYPVED